MTTASNFLSQVETDTLQYLGAHSVKSRTVPRAVRMTKGGVKVVIMAVGLDLL